MDKIRQFGNQMYYRMAQFMYGRNGDSGDVTD